MKSWDCWDTLIARRSITDIHDETNNLFPIAENVSKVQPEDIFVSDFYDGEFLRKTMPEVTGLKNETFVTGDGKASGAIWPVLKQKFDLVEHTGDVQHSDVDSPSRHGIKGTLSNISPFTAVERKFDEAGFTGLARAMREARLTTYHPSLRHLQLVQTQVNFPMLFIASVLLHRTDPKRILMSSRDCCLWYHVQKIVRDLHGATYEVVYFKSSRIAINAATPSYLEYVKGLLPATIVDLAGSGRSLLKLSSLIDHSAPLAALINPSVDERIKSFLRIEPPSVNIELINLARHPMYVDESRTYNPINVDWNGIPEIKVMHEAFEAACSISAYYNFSSDLTISDSTLKKFLHECVLGIEDYGNHFSFTDPFRFKEHDAIMNEIQRLQR